MKEDLLELLKKAFALTAGAQTEAANLIDQAMALVEAQKKAEAKPILCCQMNPMCEHVELDQAALAAIKVASSLVCGIEGIAKRITQNDLCDGIAVGKIVIDSRRGGHQACK